ncbi:MAG: hypothetical protein J6O09_02160 [Lachnospiraceae bacterium]|nr:hypothetical protein [Lachnospiraceae bacterium]
MNKPYRLIKRYIALILVLLFSIESFAAVVGDNDGAAFITKAEFDSMKNDFQSQLDRYNSSLDNKIDGAIASYLAGVGLETKTEMKNLVSNYANIQWAKDWKIKAQWKKWTAKVGPQETHNTAEWITWPAEKRRNQRNNRWMIQWMVSAFQPWLFYIYCESDFSSGRYVRGEQNTGVPVSFIQFENTSEDIYLDTSSSLLCGQEICNKDYISLGSLGESDTYVWDGAQSKKVAVWERSNQGTRLDTSVSTPAEAQAPSAGRICDLTFYVNFYNASNHSYIRVYPPENLACYTGSHQTKGNNFDWWDTLTNVSYQNGNVTSEYFASGVTCWQMTSSNYNALTAHLKKLMFGVDNSQKTNARRENRNLRQADVYKQITEYAEFDDIPMKITTVALAASPGLSVPTYGTNRVTGVSIPFTLRLPLLEQVNMGKIRNKSFQYGEKKYLRMGDGLPIVLDLLNGGELQIEFEYEINRLIDAKGSLNEIILDVKKSNFYDTVNTNANDFWKGTVNGSADKTLKGVTVNATDHKVKISVPNMKADDSLWLRLAPNNSDTDAGYYATIKNLKATLVS